MARDVKKLKRGRFIKRLLPQTLFGRSLLILVTPIILLQVVLTYVFFDRHWEKMTSRLAFAVSSEVAMIVDYAQNEDEAAFQAYIARAEKNFNFLIDFETGAALPAPETSWDGLGWAAMIRSTLSHELSKAITEPFSVAVDFQEKWIDVRVLLSDGVLNIVVPQRRLFSSTTYIFLLWVFGASIVLLVISVLFMRNQIRPIRRLALAAERFGKGRDVRHFKVEGAREVRQAGQAFLDMKTRIQRQISQRTDMLAGVSHDLRTPLTRLKLQIAMMGDGPDIYEMKKDISDMEKMIEGYLNFVRGEGREQTQFTDIPDLLREVTTSIKRQGCDVALELNDVDVVLPLRGMAFKRCLNNIVGNASKYADFIWIELQSDNDSSLTITVEDNGPGLDPSEYDKVFRPFFRVDSSRNMDEAGVGLGLPIAMDIVHSHGGEIWLAKGKRAGGLAVHIRLPI